MKSPIVSLAQDIISIIHCLVSIRFSCLFQLPRIGLALDGAIRAANWHCSGSMLPLDGSWSRTMSMYQNGGVVQWQSRVEIMK